MVILSCRGSHIKYPLVVFAGGLGSRLLGSESLPKPLVPVNSKSLLSHILLSYAQISFIGTIHVLICDNQPAFESVIANELNSIDVNLVVENNRTGRLGALHSFFNKYPTLEKLFVCNGDTIISNLDPNILVQATQDCYSDAPVVFLVNQDPSRSDYKKVLSSESENLQNSGLFYMSKNWLLTHTPNPKSPHLLDIDDILFSDANEIYSINLNTSLHDAGTPERLALVRKTFL